MRTVAARGLLVRTASDAWVAERFEHGRHALVRARVLEQLRVVDGEEAVEGIGGRRDRGGLEHARDERRGPLAHHGRHRVFVECPRSTLRQQRIGRPGEVAEGIDERAVQIEHEEANAHSVYSAYEVGVSHTVTRTTGSPCWLAWRKMSCAICSTVGLL